MSGAGAFGSWLLGQVASDSRKRLTSVVLGDDQERALTAAASSAVRRTAEELCPDNERRAVLAAVLTELFSEPIPGTSVSAHATLVESLQAAIARQLAVLDDADLTGTGTSAAELLEVPATVVTTMLTSHLFREIELRGLAGGPLSPLAAQLNHDITHLQSQRIEALLSRLTEGIPEAPNALERGFGSERNLIFRVYVPSGRLYAAEIDKLLSLFQDWLSDTGRHSIRKDGYRTSAGQYYEFFQEGPAAHDRFTSDLDDFTGFLTTCVENPPAAVKQLSRVGLDVKSAEARVARYAREVRRLNLDLRQERESRILVIRHAIESELLDFAAENRPTPSQVDRLIEAMVPDISDLAPVRLLTPSAETTSSSLTININQQVIHAIESAVVQNIQGTVNLGTQARELLELVNRFGGQEAADLQAAVHELEDPNGRPANRMDAKQRLRTFLVQLGGKVEDAALTALMAYLQTKAGL
jgi:hypothetical protein